MPGLPASMQIPDDIVCKIKSLDDDLADGVLTDKGYWKKKSCLLKKHLQDEPKKQLDAIEASLKSKQLTDDEYIVQVKDLFEDVNNYEGIEIKAVKKETNGTKQCVKSEADEVENEQDEHVKKETNGRRHSVKRKADDADTDAVGGQAKKVASHQIDNECKKSNGNKQMDIKSMFNKAADKIKENANGCSKKSVSKSLPSRCAECRQFLDDGTVSMYPGDPTEAVEELTLLFDDRLMMEDSQAGDSEDQRPQHKITNFTVYCKNEHICSFDAGLLEQNKELFFSGFVKPIYDDDPSPQGGIAAKRIGPIIEWWSAGFDGGEKCLVGFSTLYCHYFMMSPSEQYKPYTDSIQQKVYMNKAVIEFLNNNPYATYEELLHKLETVVPPQGLSSFNEDALLKHAQFIVDQVSSYDDIGDDDDSCLLLTPCMRALIKLTGVSLGQRRKIRKQKEKEFRVKKTHTKATTTSLVGTICEEFFKDEMNESNAKNAAQRRKRCGVCEACQTPECGECSACKDMVKFGGSGRAKQACLKRRCPNKAVEEADDDDLLSDEEVEDVCKPKAVPSPMKKVRDRPSKYSKAAVKWLDEPIERHDGNCYYNTAMVNMEQVNVNDNVLVAPNNADDSQMVARVVYMWQTKNGDNMFHAHWYCRGNNTVLGDVSDPKELFIVDECEDAHMDTIISLASVIHKEPSQQWSQEGGEPESFSIDQHAFFYQKFYSSESARFEDPPHQIINNGSVKALDSCISCNRLEQLRNQELPIVDEQIKEESGKTYYSHVMYNNEKFNVGDCVYISPDAYKMPGSSCPKKRNHLKQDYDEETYPEYYRKTSEYVKGSNQDLPAPFHIGKIKQIFQKRNSMSFVDQYDVYVKVQKFYRPQNTSMSSNECTLADLNMLYWSDDESVVEWQAIQGKCSVVYKDNLHDGVADYTKGGPNRFYFFEAYNSQNKSFDEPPTSAKLMGSKGKGKGKGKGSKQTVQTIQLQTYPTCRKLRSLDVFAGCGGLSEGFHQANLSESCWAIEKEEPAAHAFKLNFPKAEVFTEDCNDFLRLVMDGEKTNSKGQALPQKGDVEILCGGPPCQGFSGMNRFNSREYSKFKNSLIVSYLSFCDYYRPKFFLLENVRNFVSFKKSMVLKLALRCLLRMGYQCTFGVLQAGQYGVAQTRRRAIILAAAPGQVLPTFPEPTHVFTQRACSLSVVVDDVKFTPTMKWTSAPYRTITVRDVMSDLPEIPNGSKHDPISYGGDPQTHFQKFMRGTTEATVVHDHIVKEMNPLVAARIKHIPLNPGSDWRDLPNIAIKLSNGTFCSKLIYTFKDKKNGNADNGSLRGVCSCAMGKPCDPTDKQDNTLIPWCLPHTGNRHNHWAGLYGRLEYDGFFSTTVTNPEPMGKQGRVLHPEQNRVVSVRECARSQGFPDSFRFYGSILDRHRQVGNAVPPPLAVAIGRQILKCVHQVDNNEMVETDKC